MAKPTALSSAHVASKRQGPAVRPPARRERCPALATRTPHARRNLIADATTDSTSNPRNAGMSPAPHRTGDRDRPKVITPLPNRTISVSLVTFAQPWDGRSPACRRPPAKGIISSWLIMFASLIGCSPARGGCTGTQCENTRAVDTPPQRRGWTAGPSNMPLVACCHPGTDGNWPLVASCRVSPAPAGYAAELRGVFPRTGRGRNRVGPAFSHRKRNGSKGRTEPENERGSRPRPKRGILGRSEDTRILPEGPR